MRELGKKHGDHLVVKDLDATTDENKPKQTALGFQSHGLVIKEATTKSVVFKQADHSVNKDDVAKFVADYLAENQ